jgi:hypothetical protein
VASLSYASEERWQVKHYLRQSRAGNRLRHAHDKAGVPEGRWKAANSPKIPLVILHEPHLQHLHVLDLILFVLQTRWSCNEVWVGGMASKLPASLPGRQLVCSRGVGWCGGYHHRLPAIEPPARAEEVCALGASFRRHTSLAASPHFSHLSAAACGNPASTASDLLFSSGSVFTHSPAGKAASSLWLQGSRCASRRKV